MKGVVERSIVSDVVRLRTDVDGLFPHHVMATGDLYEIVKPYAQVIFDVYAQSGGFTLDNWIGNTDGTLVKFGNIMIAVSGWTGSSYFNMLWGNNWLGWKQIY